MSCHPGDASPDDEKPSYTTPPLPISPTDKEAVESKPSPLHPSAIPHFWDGIIEHVDNATRRALRLTSRDLPNLVEPYLFSHVAVHIYHKDVTPHYVIGHSAALGPIPRLDWNGGDAPRARCRKLLPFVKTLDIVLHCLPSEIPIKDDELDQLESLLSNVTAIRCNDKVVTVFSFPRLKTVHGFFTCRSPEVVLPTAPTRINDLLPAALPDTVTKFTASFTIDDEFYRFVARQLRMTAIHQCKNLKSLTISLCYNNIRQRRRPVYEENFGILFDLFSDIEPILSDGAVNVEFQGLEIFLCNWVLQSFTGPQSFLTGPPGLELLRIWILASLFHHRNAIMVWVALLRELELVPDLNDRERIVLSRLGYPSPPVVTKLPHPDKVETDVGLRMYLLPTPADFPPS